LSSRIVLALALDLIWRIARAVAKTHRPARAGVCLSWF
jgi:hypothetical protein